jgi:hypothetical protein
MAPPGSRPPKKKTSSQDTGILNTSLVGSPSPPGPASDGYRYGWANADDDPQGRSSGVATAGSAAVGVEGGDAVHGGGGKP